MGSCELVNGRVVESTVLFLCVAAFASVVLVWVRKRTAFSDDPERVRRRQVGTRGALIVLWVMTVVGMVATDVSAWR